MLIANNKQSRLLKKTTKSLSFFTIFLSVAVQKQILWWQIKRQEN